MNFRRRGGGRDGGNSSRKEILFFKLGDGDQIKKKKSIYRKEIVF